MRPRDILGLESGAGLDDVFGAVWSRCAIQTRRRTRGRGRFCARLVWAKDAYVRTGGVWPPPEDAGVP
eukprot:463895-Lingulodinium_polyedra.AAC.1